MSPSHNRFFIFLILVFSLQIAQGQSSSQRFRAGVNVGLNISQIDGDTYAGYRKAGLQAGIQGIAKITDRLFLSLEFLYSQRGARPSNKEKVEDFDNFINIRLNYIEIPILLNVYTSKKEGDYYHFQFFGGASIGRLIEANIEETGESVDFYPYLQLNSVKEEFIDFDVSLVIGIQRNFSKYWGIYVKHSLSLRDLYRPSDQDSPFNPLTPYHLTIGASYVFF